MTPIQALSISAKIFENMKKENQLRSKKMLLPTMCYYDKKHSNQTSLKSAFVELLTFVDSIK